MNNERYEFKSIEPQRKKVNKEKRYGLVVILVLLISLAAIIAFVIMQTQNFFGGSTSHFVSVPVIETHLVSQDGNLHMFGTRVVIELDNDAPAIDREQLYNAVSAAVSSLSYEDITSYHGMENLRNAVRDRLSASFSDEELLGVYFAQFLSDMPLPNLEEERVPGRNPFVDAIMGN